MIVNHSRYLLLINGAVLIGCAVFDYAWRDTLLVALLLFLPFIDPKWSFPIYKQYRYQWLLWLITIVLFTLIIIDKPLKLYFVLYTLLLVALPEEWFFRGYFLRRVEVFFGGEWASNLITSVVFALMHVPVQGWNGLTVFIPSLFFGWLYQRNRDLILVILVHALFNCIYSIYLRDLLF